MTKPDAPAGSAAMTEQERPPGRSPLWSFPAGRATKWLVLFAWVALVVGVSPLAAKMTDAQKNDAAVWLPASAESTKVVKLQDRFPGGDSTLAVVVYQRDSGVTDADRSLAERHLGQLSSKFGGDPQQQQLQRSEDGKALAYSIPLSTKDGGQQVLDDVTEIRDLVGEGGDGLNVKVTGSAGSLADTLDAFSGLDVKIALASLLVVGLILLMTYRSPVLWIVPLFIVGLASQVASAGVYGLIKAFDLTVNDVDALVLIVLVFGAGTDYALLLIARYREELRHHQDRHVAMQRALRGAGPAIIASGATVSLGLLCLLAADLGTNKSLGPVGAAGVLVALAAMTTLLPALLVILGRWVFWPFVPRVGQVGREHTGFFARQGARISRRPSPVWIFTVLILGVLTIGLTQLPGPLKQVDQFSNNPDSVQGQKLLDQSFPSGSGRPVFVVSNTPQAQDVLAAVKSSPNVAQAQVATTSTDGDLTAVMAIIDADPDSTTEREALNTLRDRVHDVSGADAVVGGEGAQNLDLARTSERDRSMVIPLVLLVVLLVLAVLLRAVVAPIVLMATVVLGFAAALGVSSVIFTRLFHFGGADPALPLAAFVFLVALGVDYNIFLMGRVREESERHGTREGTKRALAVTGGVITAAALVLAATFGTLTILPQVPSIELGFVVAFGVLLDVLVVTMLVPALTIQLDRRMWWPSRLSRRTAPAAPVAGPAGEPESERVDETARESDTADASSTR